MLKPLMTRPSEWTSELDGVIAEALRGSLDVARRNSLSADPTEVDFVFAIFQRGLRRINAGLQRLARTESLRASVAGVFCHQQPLVKAPSWSRGCELGDLLFVVQFKAHEALPPQANALLLQFKVGNLSLTTGGSQTDLYLNWPDFRITRGYSPGEAGRHWHISAPAPHSGAQYAVIDSDPDDLQAVPLCACLDPACTARELAWELTDTIDFSSGRGFDGGGPSHGHSDWNELIWHLLQQTAMQRLSLRSSGIKLQGYPRGPSSALCLTRAFDADPPGLLAYAAPDLADVWAELVRQDSEVWDVLDEDEEGAFQPPPDDLPRMRVGRDGGGISVVVISLEPDHSPHNDK